MTRLVVADVGGTHARFALASIDGARVAELSEPRTLKTREHDGFESAWLEFGRLSGGDLPERLAIAFAGPVDGNRLRLTNSHWEIDRQALAAALGLEQLLVVNDFGAVAHAIAVLGEEHFLHLAGPDRAFMNQGVVTVVGPGTGLGVAQLLLEKEGTRVIETEGGHISFAPAGPVEEQILALLRKKFGRVSVERLVSGPGLLNTHEALAAIEDRKQHFTDEKQLWSAALEGEDEAAVAALDQFCAMLGSAAGDLALAHGASAVVVAGGLGLRLRAHLAASAFAGSFAAKGRYEERMKRMPVKLVVHPQPGLYGAAAAFADRYCRAELQRSR